jgi:hypothetical protein
MPVEIHTLTSQVNVADEATPTAALLEKITAMVLERIHDAQAARDFDKHEQEIRRHMSESRF